MIVYIFTLFFIFVFATETLKIFSISIPLRFITASLTLLTLNLIFMAMGDSDEFLPGLFASVTFLIISIDMKISEKRQV